MQQALLGEVSEQLEQVLLAELVADPKGQLEGGAAQVLHQDQQLIRVDACVLRRGADEKFRIAHDVLIERITRFDEHAEGRALAPPGAAEPLPGGGDGARIAVQQADIERADVDAEFEGIGGDDAISPSARNCFSVARRSVGK
jgi:hypothetical protein